MQKCDLLYLNLKEYYEFTFGTGGSAEILDKTCGRVIEKNNAEALERAVEDICSGKDFIARENCVLRASHFDKNDKFTQYIDLYGKTV